MKFNLWLLAVNAALAVFSGSFVYGAEAVFPAAQIEKGKSSLTVAYGESAEKLSFRVTGRDEVKVGNLSYLSESSNDLEGDGKSRSVYAKMLFNPSGGLYYWLKAGVGDYALELPSATVRNRFSGQDKGWLIGFGARKLLFPDTIVTPAIAVDMGLNYSAYTLDWFRSGQANPSFVSDKLEIAEFALSVTVSKKINSLEPYGGFRVYRKNLILTDKAALANVSGIKDNASLFFGARINFFEREALVIEGSISGDSGISAGLNIGF